MPQPPAPASSATESRPLEPSGSEPRSSRVLLTVVVALAAMGLALSGELTHLHRQVYLNPSYSSFCAVNDTVNCDSVARSAHSVFVGVPISVWGLLGYALIASLALVGLRARRYAFAAGALLLLSAFSLVTTVALGAISYLAISALCLLCLATYAVNVALAIVAWLLFRRQEPSAPLREVTRFLSSTFGTVVAVALAAVVAALTLGYPKYWEQAHAAPLAPAAAAVGSGAAMVLPHGVTASGSPWIGAENPKFTIEEFSDYQCPHCAQSNLLLRALVQKSPTELRVVHHHYPLSNACNPAVQGSFHEQACIYSVMAACAQEQGLFWPVNDYLFAHGEADAAPILPGHLGREIPSLDVAKLKACVADGSGLKRVTADIEEGRRIPVDGTPTYRVNGKLHEGGRLPEELLAPYFRKLAE